MEEYKVFCSHSLCPECFEKLEADVPTNEEQ